MTKHWHRNLIFALRFKWCKNSSWIGDNVRSLCNIFPLNKCYYLGSFPLKRNKPQSHTLFTLWSARKSRGYWWCLYSCCCLHFVACTWQRRYNVTAASAVVIATSSLSSLRVSMLSWIIALFYRLFNNKRHLCFTEYRRFTITNIENHSIWDYLNIARWDFIHRNSAQKT